MSAFQLPAIHLSPLLDNYFAQTWSPTVQEVLQADWQDAWHSPQPPVCTVLCSEALFTVVIRLAIVKVLLKTKSSYFIYFSLFYLSSQEKNHSTGAKISFTGKLDAPGGENSIHKGCLFSYFPK